MTEWDGERSWSGLRPYTLAHDLRMALARDRQRCNNPVPLCYHNWRARDKVMASEIETDFEATLDDRDEPITVTVTASGEVEPADRSVGIMSDGISYTTLQSVTDE